MKIFKIAGLACLSISLLAQASQTLMNIPTGSKIIFKQNFTIPPGETSVLIGSTRDAYLTECHLYLKSYDNNIRMIPKGTQFSVKDTRESFGNRADLLIESNSINSLSCTSAKPSASDRPIPENYLAYTSISQAQKALGDKIQLKINNEPKLIKD